MIESSEAYKAAVVATARRTDIKAVIDITDPDIKPEGASASGGAEFSRIDDLTNKKTNLNALYFSGENNRWLLNGKGVFLPDEPTEAKYEIGYVSEAISGAEGKFEPEITAQIYFSGIEMLGAFTVCFPDNIFDGWPLDFTVEVLSNGEVKHSRSYTDNKARKVIGLGFEVSYPDTLRVIIKKWSHPGLHARIAEMVPGLLDEWSGDNLASFDVVQQADISNASVKYGTANLKIDNSEHLFNPFEETGLFGAIEEKQPVELQVGVRLDDGSTEYKPLGVFYHPAGGWSTGDNNQTMMWKLVDIVGLVANREFVPPEELPTTLTGWIEAVVAQLGKSFEKRFKVDPDYAEIEVKANGREDITGKKCGEILRFACMASGTWARADASSGFLTAEPLWNAGNRMDLDNLKAYPTIKDNADVAALIFTVYGEEEKTQLVIGGTNAASDKTINVNNPFIHDNEKALVAARQILSAYGGKQIDTVGRGNPASEIGDVDTVWFSEGNSKAGRRVYQSINYRNGVLTDCKSTLLQASGAAVFEEYTVITESSVWTAPAGVTRIRVIIGGGGSGGGLGYDGSDTAAGEKGLDGAGGMILYQDIEISEGQNFDVVIGAGGKHGGRNGGQPGDASSFGQYSSASGKLYPYGYTVASTGQTFGRSGVENPQPNSGDGGAGGKGGDQGYVDQETQTNIPPGLGFSGKDGASGFVAVFWDKTEV